MLIQLLLLIFLLTILFFLSQKISTYIYQIFFVITKNRGVAISILLFLFLPGTIIHELSHFLVATLVRVPTGELTVIPQLDKESGEVKAGRLAIAKTDLFRHTLIGLAPMIIGLLLIYIVGELFIPSPTTYNLPLTAFLGFYLFFIITNTMFSSKKDLESAVIAIPVIFLLLGTLYLVGIRLFLSPELVTTLEKTLSFLNIYLLDVTILNSLISLFLLLNLSMWRKILKR